MQIQALIEKVHHDFSIPIPQNLGEMTIARCQLIFAKPAVLTPQTLYIQAESFTLDPSAFSDSFFLMKDQGSPGRNAAVYHSGSAQDLYQALSVLLTDTEAYARAISALQQAAGKGGGIEALVKTAYQYIQNPIHVLDKMFSLIYACPQTPSGCATFDHFLIHGKPHPEYLYHVEAAIMHFSEHHIRCAQLLDYDADALKLISCSIGSLPHLLGGIEVLQLNRPFTQNDVGIINQLALLLQIELFKANNAAEKADTQFELLIQDILNRRFLHPELLQLRLQPFPQLQNRRFCLLLSQIPRSKTCTLKYYNEEIVRCVDVIESFQYQNDLYFLIDPQNWETKNHEALNKLAVKSGTLMILSDPLNSLIHCPAIVAMLQGALGVISKTNGLYLFRDLYFKTLLHSLSSPSSLTLADFIHPGIQRLKDFDQLHQTAFLETLKLYLQYQCSPTQTAARLHLHRNSLAYRLQKARQISGFFSENPQDSQNFLLAIQIDEYLGS
ncbi:PucR family transcriptional regulator [Holdemania massiliensis]|uniref:PucR C-terminal helix-turn-helix domain-containing protein n=1 Tax=Holdemania massiliensis TaxID=1468449 RepID=A0A6N7S2Q1_9FIRM|nr:helix-turn-helix domain-containing protein [Holdemania massiliensis]MSA70296.1 hypothetical protein [Holdemania massiliensis]MSA88173.1 hypothetical protein [Holdemania massiliensis]MSB77002.1 hypothetical protein [Holdemania massiliensis]MSC31928.1 hypothetical protein [Holdemania massiliensis]MSC38248.1 hypothetical protein [Holdemania massiliensis]